VEWAGISELEDCRRAAARYGPPLEQSAAMRGLVPLQIALLAALAVAFAKRTVNTGIQGGIEAGLEYERYAAGMLTDSEDRREGFRAFVEKRRPVFTGR
jgi:enoyl-CoA hydratase/carnithine racemase